jgi:raffinose/stachyose/melibiose transport system substrate-binding protein
LELSFGRIIRFITLVLVLIIGGRALMPPAGEKAKEAERRRKQEASGEEVRFVIKFNPGPPYMPGSVPYGIGEPLEGLTNVIADFEARFPDTRIEVLTIPGVREYLVTQLSSGQAPDIIMVNVEDVWVDVQKGWYIPLDPYLEAPNPFIREQGDPSLPGYDQWWDMFKYPAISRGKAAPDGLNYCISFDMVETGIFYNKDILRQLGLSEPETWDEFIQVLHRIRETPVITGDAEEAEKVVPLLMITDFFSDWCNDLFFDQLYYDLLPGIDLWQHPIREQYLEGYLDDIEVAFLFQQGFFTAADTRFRELYRIMYEFRQYTNQNLVNSDPIREFVTQKAAMVWFACPLAYRLIADRQLGFDWDVFYLPRFTEKTTAYASGEEMCVIGGSAVQLEVTNSAIEDTGEIATSKRLERVIQFLQFLCVPENYARIVNEYECFLPNIKGVEVMPALKPFEKILERRYTTTKWVYTFDLKFSEIQRRMLELYLNDGLDLDAFMEWQESNIRAAVENMLLRKGADMEMLEERWRELAPERARMEDLPVVD